MPPPDRKRKSRLDQKFFMSSPGVEKLVQVKEDVCEVGERTCLEEIGRERGFFGARRAREGDAVCQIDLLRRIVRRRLHHPIREQPGLAKHELVVEEGQGLSWNRRYITAPAGQVLIGQVEDLEHRENQA